MKLFTSLSVLAFSVLFTLFGHAQTAENLIQDYLTKLSVEQGFVLSDVQNWEITDRYTSRTSGVENVYIRQTHQGIPVYNAVANFNIKDGKIINVGIRLEKNIAFKVNATAATLTPFEAINSVARQLGIKEAADMVFLEPKNTNQYLVDGKGISREPIPVQLMFMPTQNESQSIQLVWDLSIYERSKDHYWSVRVDAITGEIIDKIDWVVECTFDDCEHSKSEHTSRRPIPEVLSAPAPAPPPGTDQYRVFAIPTESPIHGPRSLVVGPFNAVASPFGWHDTNGAAGAEFTNTQGNNVRATEDVNNNGGTGYFPSGGTALNFDFPLNLNNAPSTNLDPAITNLFYMNNIMHDVWYHYGFDEISGNFQENNYGNGAAGSDGVYAEAQDGGGTNNANFSTPPDGSNPTMQMYLWSAGGSSYLLNVNSPSVIAGQYQGAVATFGPALPTTPLTNDFVLVNDGTASANEGCNTLVNGAAISGKIAVVMRGTCGFTVKVQNAQNAGAIAVIVINNVAGAPFAMGGTSTTITIPSIMISQTDGNLILAQMASGTVNGTLQSTGTPQQIDGDFDNGIIAHEYGHGISNRLTGGPSASGCLSNAEQMGEGWSDWFGLMLTIEPGDLGSTGRGIGTYAINQPPTGGGIRPTPYSTNMTINPSTYASTNNTGSISQPHGIGYVWCTMIWDLNWALINQYGFNSNVYTGTGGNNIAMHLVTEGLKLQPCSPGFVDGRNAILAADMALYGGANQCLIWTVFANRGLGFSASQGSSTSRTDQVEAFDLPNSCQVPTQAPIANFGHLAVGCDGTIHFSDSSLQIPNQWAWTFGDGGTSTVANPIHQYTTNGTYNVKLVASNVIGSDSITIPVTISMLIPPVVANQTICANSTATLTGTASNSIIWYDNTGTIPLDTANVFTTPILTSTTSYMAENVALEPILSVGPLDASFGTSGYHSATSPFTLNFTATSTLGFTILSAWIDAGSIGTRTINVWNGSNASGTIIGTAIVNITQTGGQRIPINIDVPSLGDYSIGGTGMDLRRNNGGVPYPYTLPGIVNITGSSAGSSSQFYYYLYDWEVQEIACRSAKVPVTVTVNNGDSTFQTTSNCGQYVWPTTGLTYSSSGQYSTTLTNSIGCDSVVTLNLTVSSSTINNQSFSGCNSYTWPANGVTYTSSGSYTVTYPNTNGCDSTINLNLTIANQTTGSETINTCSPFTWTANGTTYSSTGMYNTTLTNAAGCDSLVTLNLTVGTPTSLTQTVNTCNSYTWPTNGLTYSNSGTHSATLTNTAGCDSTVTLNLTIATQTSGSETVNSCNPYTWSANGTTYSSSGVYNTTLTNAAGCDSLVTLNLTVGTPSSAAQTVNTCNSYTWPSNGLTYSNSGTHTAILTNASGCDSTITLNLTINQGSTETLVETACDSYTWSATGQNYTATGAYSITFTNAAGCDSILNLNLTINTVNVGVTPTGDVSLQANTISATYQWIDCDNGNTPISGATNQTFTATSNGSYAVIVAQNGCSDTSDCFLISKVGLLENDFGIGLKVYPNPTQGNLKIDLGANYSQINVKVFDAKGKLVNQKGFVDVQVFDLEIEGVNGVYFVRLETGNGLKAGIEILKK